MSRIFKYLAPLCWFAAVAIVAGIFYILGGLLLSWLLPSDALAINDLQRAVGELLAMLCCFGSFFFPRHAPASAPDSILTTRAIQRRGPLLLGLIFFTSFVAYTLLYLEKIYYTHIGELWSQLIFISEYPFLLGVVLSLPAHPLSRFASLRVVLASILIVTAVLTFSWYFFLGPIVLYGPQPVLGKVMVVISLCEDLVTLFSFLILASRTSDANVRPARYVLLLGIAFLLVGDGLGGYSIVQTGSTSGNPQEALWGISSVLFIISAYYMRFTESPSTEGERKQKASKEASSDLSPLWHTWLPSALVPAVIVLMTYVWLVGHNDTLAQGVYLGGAVLLGLVVLRQVFSLRETHFYTQKLRLMQEELQTKNRSLAEANLQLEVQAKEIERAYEQQRHLNELKDQFLLNVSHELRTPLTVLGGSLELLEEHHEDLDLESRTHLLKEAHAGQEELADLVNRMLDATAIVSGTVLAKLEGVSLCRLLQEVLAHLTSLQDYTICQQVPEQIMVLADPQFLRQVLRNLLSNISKYVPARTEIHIQVTQTAPTLPVCLSVQDAGPGVPAEELPLLFEKFVRLQRDLAGSTRGTGLGLYICKQLVQAMGGHIWVESSGRLGEGSRFCVVLPPFSPLPS